MAETKSSNDIHAEATGQKSVFEHLRTKAYPFRYEVGIVMDTLAGGIPSDPKVAEGWIKTKVMPEKDEHLREMVAKTLIERGVAKEGEVEGAMLDEAIAEAATLKHLNGFKRDENGQLYIEGRQVKAMIKEDANVRWPKERWGISKKGTKSFFAEHVFVEEDIIGMGIKETRNPDGTREVSDPRFRINQRFVHTWRGAGIQLEEVVSNVELTFHIVTDHEFTEDQWGTLFLTAEQNGLGAARSQGFGTFTVVKFDKVKHIKKA